MTMPTSRPPQRREPGFSSIDYSAAQRWTGSTPASALAPVRDVRLARSPQRSLGTGGRCIDIRLLAVSLFPEPLFLQRVRNFLGHVSFIMLGERGVGPEHAGGVERAFGDDALPLAKQIRENSVIGNRQRRAAVGNPEANREVVAMYQRARLHQPSQAEPPARCNMFFGHHRGCR